MADKIPNRPDYVAIATPLVARGFRVTPVHPETKSGVMKNWQNHQATTPAEVLKHAKYYPNHNVGVVGKRGVGRHMFLDIDADGVLERIETETGYKMPQTYTVWSRPESAPYKSHFYFTQTEYSFKRFGSWNAKNINVRDLTRLERSRSGRLIHTTLYDVKGIGGGHLSSEQVVSATLARSTPVSMSPLSPRFPTGSSIGYWLILENTEVAGTRNSLRKIRRRLLR